VFQTVKMMVVTNPADTAGGRSWLLVGAGLMLALLTFRRRVFWLPHPIGLIMLMNPLMDGCWFSILLGWIFKVLVSKYGDKNTYARFRFFFTGLIVGEVLAKGYTYHVGALDSQVALWQLWQ